MSELQFCQRGYSVFLELVHGCNRSSCTTRSDCSARFHERREMPPPLACQLLEKLATSTSEINNILLFGRGDSTDYDMSRVILPDILMPKLVACLTSPYTNNYSGVTRIARVDTVDEAETLLKSGSAVSRTFTIVQKDTFGQVAEVVKLLHALPVEITLVHYDPRYDPNPSERRNYKYVPLPGVIELLRQIEEEFVVLDESPVSGFRDGRAFIIDAYGNVVPCFYMDRPFFAFDSVHDTARRLESLTRPCEICRDKQPQKWKIELLSSRGSI